MATLYIRYYDGLAHAQEESIPVPGSQVLVGGHPSDTVTIGAVSDQSAAIPATARFAKLSTDTVCQWEEGANPTADGNSNFLAANDSEFVRVTPGNKIAVIDQQ